jgi:hypothetical protein
MKIKAIQPMFNGIVTTADVYEADLKVNGVILNGTKGSLKDHQRVIAVGPYVKDIHKGDLVCVIPDRFAVKKFSENSMRNDIEGMKNETVGYNFDFMELDSQPVLFLQDRDIKYVVTEYSTDDENQSNLVEVEDAVIIGTDTPKIVI